MNDVPVFVNALFCIKAILSDSKYMLAEVPLLLPKGGKKRAHHIMQLKNILSPYLFEDGFKVDSSGDFVTINRSRINHNTPAKFFDASYYPAI